MDNYFITETLNKKTHSCDIKLTPFDNSRLMNLCGRFDEHLRQIEQRLGIEITGKSNSFHITGTPEATNLAKEIITALYKQTSQPHELTPNQVHLLIQQLSASSKVTNKAKKNDNTTKQYNIKDHINLTTPMEKIIPRTKNQHTYVKNILAHDINFGIGPAGTGKTFLAVACAIEALQQHKIRRILLVRPVIEAGERLGFLPGDFTQKIDPYIRPLYDALYEMLGFEKVSKLLERQVIEIAPLAYMRGRTLNDAFIILDESQNTTVEQMQMFLTRIGFSSTTVITGDLTQVDLPKGKKSGLHHAKEILSNIKSISFTYFESKDVIRHPIVQEIIEAYATDNQSSFSKRTK